MRKPNGNRWRRLINSNRSASRMIETFLSVERLSASQNRPASDSPGGPRGTLHRARASLCRPQAGSKGSDAQLLDDLASRRLMESPVTCSSTNARQVFPATDACEGSSSRTTVPTAYLRLYDRTRECGMNKKEVSRIFEKFLRTGAPGGRAKEPESGSPSWSRSSPSMAAPSTWNRSRARDRGLP